MKFNEKLIELRKKEGLSQEELGYKLNVTRQTVSKWELGQTTPEMDKLSEMSKVFNVSVDQLINDSEIGYDSNVDPINSKIVDQPIQESGKNNKKVFIGIIVVVAVLVLVVAGAITKYISNKKAEKAAGEIFNMATGIINGAIGGIQSNMNGIQNNNPGAVGGEISNMASGIINSTINGMQNGSNKNEIANSMQEGMDFISGIIGGNISDQMNQTQNQISVQAFNGPIEIYAGTSKKLFATTVLDNIITSNKTNDRKITVKYNKTETQDEAKIRSIKQTINKADPFQDFEIICEYDAQGYIYKVIIEKV